ncbi:hypothetical protein RvY_16671 [Ramazzottius varieornatus]|uniref:Uncharacterized protein n=1 Tax=Ramazzottius varieornatus TaxID=947166 RepID=A0A1D1W014_RAMVA|nr:hypothetical protein RvY_16671 [Ramazzottius varieornatus]
MGSVNPPALNLTIVSYILLPPVLLSSRPFNGPALDLGAERLRTVHNFNVTLKYIGSFNWSTVDGMVENTYLVSRYFAQEWDRNGVVVLHAPGM